MTKARSCWIRCPHCKQTLAAARFGVRLRPLQVRIVDAIVRASPDGIARADLSEMIYGDTPVSRHAISVHVTQINEALGTRSEYRIKGGRDGYRVVHEQTRAVA